MKYTSVNAVYKARIVLEKLEEKLSGKIESKESEMDKNMEKI